MRLTRNSSPLADSHRTQRGSRIRQTRNGFAVGRLRLGQERIECRIEEAVGIADERKLRLLIIGNEAVDGERL